MDLQASVIDSQTDFSVVDNVIPLCELAKGLEEAGEFESAAETLQPFWRGLAHRPQTDGLDDQAKAELLLRTGTLTGWLGSDGPIQCSRHLARVSILFADITIMDSRP